MSSQQNEDLERIRESIGGHFDFVPADEALSDAATENLTADATAPSLSTLKKQRLGSEENADSNPGEEHGSDSRDDLFRRFTTAADDTHETAAEAAREPVLNRVYLKRPKNQSDVTEAFAPKPVIVSGTTGKITERG
jgi:hypothetical protein